jgi:hypothetical protein
MKFTVMGVVSVALKALLIHSSWTAYQALVD